MSLMLAIKTSNGQRNEKLDKAMESLNKLLNSQEPDATSPIYHRLVSTLNQLSTCEPDNEKDRLLVDQTKFEVRELVDLSKVDPSRCNREYMDQLAGLSDYYADSPLMLNYLKRCHARQMYICHKSFKRSLNKAIQQIRQNGRLIEYLDQVVDSFVKYRRFKEMSFHEIAEGVANYMLTYCSDTRQFIGSMGLISIKNEVMTPIKDHCFKMFTYHFDTLLDLYPLLRPQLNRVEENWLAIADLCRQLFESDTEIITIISQTQMGLLSEDLDQGSLSTRNSHIDSSADDDDEDDDSKSKSKSVSPQLERFYREFFGDDSFTEARPPRSKRSRINTYLRDSNSGSREETTGNLANKGTSNFTPHIAGPSETRIESAEAAQPPWDHSGHAFFSNEPTFGLGSTANRFDDGLWGANYSCEPKRKCSPAELAACARGQPALEHPAAEEPSGPREGAPSAIGQDVQPRRLSYRRRDRKKPPCCCEH